MEIIKTTTTTTTTITLGSAVIAALEAAGFSVSVDDDRIVLDYKMSEDYEADGFTIEEYDERQWDVAAKLTGLDFDRYLRDSGIVDGVSWVRLGLPDGYLKAGKWVNDNA